MPEAKLEVNHQNYAMSIAGDAFGLLMDAGGGLPPVLAAILHNASSDAVVTVVRDSSITTHQTCIGF